MKTNTFKAIGFDVIETDKPDTAMSNYDVVDDFLSKDRELLRALGEGYGTIITGTQHNMGIAENGVAYALNPKNMEEMPADSPPVAMAILTPEGYTENIADYLRDNKSALNGAGEDLLVRPQDDFAAFDDTRESKHSVKPEDFHTVGMVPSKGGFQADYTAGQPRYRGQFEEFSGMPAQLATSAGSIKDTSSEFFKEFYRSPKEFTTPVEREISWKDPEEILEEILGE